MRITNMGDCCAIMNCHCMEFYSENEQCHPMCHHMSICQSRKLLQGPITNKFYEEHVSYLTTFVNDSKDGFYVNDLLHLNRVLEMLSKRLETTPAYVPIFEKMLIICSIPPLLHDTLESLTGLVYLADYMTVLGLLPTWFSNDKFRRLVYKALANLLMNVKPMNITYSSVGYRYIAIENSYLPEIITQKLESVTNKEYDTILNISLLLTNISHTVCRKMIEVNAINFLLLRLVPEIGASPKVLNMFAESKEFSDKLNKTCAILTNLVESLRDLDKDTLEKFAPNPELIWIIRYVLRGILPYQSHKQCRNNLMDFLLLCLDIFPCIHFVECNLFDDIALLSVATELDTSNTWAKDVEFVNDDYDILFKKMLLTSLCFIHKYETLHLIFENRNVIVGLLKIISPEYQSDWHPDTHESMKKYALIALYNIVSRSMNNFVGCKGSQSLLISIQTYIMDPSECNREILEKSLKCLTKFTVTKYEPLLDNIRKFGGISILTLLCNNILQKSIITSYDQQTLVYSFCILGKLYSNHSLPKDTSIKLITKYLNRILKPKREDSYIDARAVICVIDFLWEIIRYDHDKLMMFMKMEGVYLLLDTIQTSPFPVQVIGLGCLIDLCDESLCIPYLLTWRGGEDKKQIFFSLLANIFRTECEKIETSLDENDIIINTEYPLMGKLQYNETISLNKDTNSSPALLDLFGSSRPKVYALLQLLKVRYKDKVELTNEHYRICSIPVTVKDRVILHLAENFFALKLAETWKELSRDLANSNITPVYVDARMLNILSEKMQKWNENVQQEQQAIINYESQKETYEESKLYSKMKKCRLRQAIDALRELRYFAKISDTMFRLAQKQRQQKEIEDSLILPVDSKCNMHRTYMDQIDVTSIFHLKYNLIYN